MRIPYRDDYLILNRVYMKALLSLIKYMREWIDEIYACATRSSPPRGQVNGCSYVVDAVAGFRIRISEIIALVQKPG